MTLAQAAAALNAARAQLAQALTAAETIERRNSSEVIGTGNRARTVPPSDPPTTAEITNAATAITAAITAVNDAKTALEQTAAAVADAARTAALSALIAATKTGSDAAKGLATAIEGYRRRGLLS